MHNPKGSGYSWNFKPCLNSYIESPSFNEPENKNVNQQILAGVQYGPWNASWHNKR